MRKSKYSFAVAYADEMCKDQERSEKIKKTKRLVDELELD